MTTDGQENNREIKSSTRRIQKIIKDFRLYIILSIKGILNNVKGLYKVIWKHSTPFSTNTFFKNESLSDRVTLIGVCVNIFMFCCKYIGGSRYGSAVLIADAFHSLSDMIADFITLWAVQIARLPPDDDHPYGHGKFEAIGSLFLSIILILTGISIATWSYENMLEVIAISSNSAIGTTFSSGVDIKESINPTWPAVILAAISIACKEWLYRITNQVGVALNSQVIIANAWHHRSDACSSILSMVSIIIAILFPNLLFIDSAAGIVVAGMICLTGFEIMCESMKQLTDTVDAELASDVQVTVLNIPGVLEVEKVRARSCGSAALVDLTVLTVGHGSAEDMQILVEKIRTLVCQKFPHIAEILVQTASRDQKRSIAASPDVSPLQQLQGPVTDMESEIHQLLVQDADVTGVVKLALQWQNQPHQSLSIISVETVIAIDNTRHNFASACIVLERIRDDIKRLSGDIGVVRVYVDLVGRSGYMSP